jgi:Zn-dependent protease
MSADLHAGHEHGHTHDDTHEDGSSWSMAVRATLHCLTGCAIGEILGMIISAGLGLGAAASVALSILLAFVFGYGLSARALVGAVGTRRALRIALAADTVSIATMELVDNGFIIAVPGALSAQLTDALFWISLALSLALAFIAAVPVNRWLIARGQGHALVHHLH